MKLISLIHLGYQMTLNHSAAFLRFRRYCRCKNDQIQIEICILLQYFNIWLKRFDGGGGGGGWGEKIFSLRTQHHDCFSSEDLRKISLRFCFTFSLIFRLRFHAFFFLFSLGD